MFWSAVIESAWAHWLASVIEAGYGFRVGALFWFRFRKPETGVLGSY
jgi:hypothetical protein